MSEPLVFCDQPFEAGFFGGPVWRLAPPPAPPAIGDLNALLDTARTVGVRLISVRLPGSMTATAIRFQDAGFRRIETLITYERPIEPGAMPTGIRPARPEDVEACATLAKRSFSSDRFHADPELPNAAADALKAGWVRGAFAGRAQAILLSEGPNGPNGFILLLIRDGTATVDLVAVAPEARGQGIGTVLLRAAAHVCAPDAGVLRAGTQQANRASTAMYERDGFRQVSTQHTLHWTPPVRVPHTSGFEGRHGDGGDHGVGFEIEGTASARGSGG